MAVITAVVTIFGGLTLILRDDTFVKMKPTILSLFAGILGFGLLRGQSSSSTSWTTIPMRDEGPLVVAFYILLGPVNEMGLAHLRHEHLGDPSTPLRAAGGELPAHHGPAAAVGALCGARAKGRTKA